MIFSLEGKIEFKSDKFVVINVSGVGYKVFLSQEILNKIPTGSQSAKLFTFLDVKENALNLYGFLTTEELEFFEILNDIQGIGPKAALKLSILGPLEKIKKSILAGDEKIFAGISGIGSKRIQTIILELTGKIKEFEKPKKGESDEAEDALVDLGFSRQRVREALQKLPKDIKDAEEKIKTALKILGK